MTLTEDTIAEIVLIHTRLSILDLSTAGRQPMSDPTRRIQVVYNGEIYNYRELRESLRTHGHTFQTGTDTEVLLAAYREWGAAAFERFTGMFALVLVDLERRVVHLARDPFGIKPLYYLMKEDRLFFASEIPVLLRLADVQARADPERLFQFLRFGLTDHGGGTMVAGVKQIPAGYRAEALLGRPTKLVLHRNWDPRSSSPCRPGTFAEAADAVRERFLENLRLHLRSDVPVGAALSGGIDSSAIAIGSRLVGGERSELHVFSYVAGEPEVSEARWAALAGEAASATVHRVTPGPLDLLRDLEQIVRAQGEPFASTSVYAQYVIFREAARCGIPVMLNGQGADEVFGGYHPYLGARLASLVVQGRWREAVSYTRRAGRLSGLGVLKLIQYSAEHLLPTDLQAVVRRLVGRGVMPSWLDFSWFRERGVEPAALRRPQGRERLREELTRTLTEINLPHLLRYDDRNSMAWSVESRVPFLTTDLVTLAHWLPEHYLLSPSGETKSVLRAALRGIVPDPILDRRDKVAFATPESVWVPADAPWVRELLSDEAAQAIPPLAAACRRADNSGDIASLGSHRALWRALSLVAWTRAFEVTYS